MKLRDIRIGHTDEEEGTIHITAYSRSFGDRVIVAIVQWDATAPDRVVLRAEAVELARAIESLENIAAAADALAEKVTNPTPLRYLAKMARGEGR